MYLRLIKPVSLQADCLMYFRYLTLNKIDFISKNHILLYCWQNM